MKRMNEKIYAVAVDGPSGAGKSTLARAAAERLGILYVDTGAIYRTIGVYVYRHHIDPKDAAAVAAVLPEITISLRYDEVGLQRMYLNGEDVTKEIRLPAMSMYASDVSAIPAVRDYLMELDQTKPVVYCGDLNVAHQEIDLKNPKSNRMNPGFSDEERAKMTQLLASGFTDTFRYLYPDKTGAYSWWSYRFNARKNNAGWRIDYFIVSDRLKDKIKSADIWSEVTGSDHCPVVLELDL